VTADGRVTVVVLTHDRRDELLRTLEHLAALDEQPPIIVVDNGSSDGTARAVGERFPLIRLVRLEANRGAAGRNAGIARAGTPYVALCDDDTAWTSGALARAADSLDADPGLAVVTARVLVGDDERPDPACLAMARSPLPGRRGQAGVPVLGFLAGACVVRRAAILSVGGFEPRLFLGAEEWLLAADLAAAGWTMAYVDGIQVHHHPSPVRDGDGRRRILARNEIWLAWLRRPARIAWRVTWRALREAGPGRWQVLRASLAGLPWVLRERRCLPPEVERWRRLLDDQDASSCR
jgi:GT2 family glycosyltransferase